jgi:hypothetical protein
MGAFFTNVQVRSTSEGDLDRLVAFYRSHLGALGFQEVEVEADALADRTILLLRSGPWIAVYDEGTDTGAVDVMGLGVTISTALSTAVIAVSVHDSDIVDLELVEAGERRDRYCSAPEYFEVASDARRAQVAGQPSAWKEWLVDGKAEGDLRRAFDERLTFAERTLHEIGDLVAIDRSILGRGYRYAVDGDGPPADRTLRFRLKVRPAHETLAEGPPRLGAPYGRDRHDGQTTEYPFMVGSPAQVAGTVRNLGGKGRGVEVWVEGEALDRGLVRVTRMNVVMGSPRAGSHVEAIPEERREGGRLRVVGTFTDAPIPEGFVGDLDALMRARPDKMIEIMHGSNVHANVHLDPRVPGTGGLRVTVVPIENRLSSYGDDMVLSVAEAAPRPLRSRAEVYPHELTPLLGRTQVFLLVSFDTTREEAASSCSRFASEWKFVLGSPKKLHATTFHRDRKLAPTTEEGFDLSKLEEAFRSTQVVTLATEVTGHSSSGLSFGTRIVPPLAGDGALCPTFALWADVSKNAGSRARYEEMLSAIAERAMSEHSGIQALVGCWGWVPTSLDSTPYESVCDIHGETLTRSWLTRFVRAVAPGKIWLGKELVARVDRAALEAVAEVGECGSGLRVRVADDVVSVRAVEDAIAPLLPTMDDGLAARRAERG